MKIPFLFVALLFAPALAPADDAPASVPAPSAAPEAFPKTTAFRQQVLEKFDAYNEGTLSDAERATAKSALKARRDGGKASEGEKGERKASAMHRQLMKQFDEDHDGLLSEAERAKARAARKHKTTD
jgi:hypothetical protein